MATTTTNYGFDIPQSTDLVKDGATAIATLGQDIDTAMNTALGTKKAGMVLLNTTSFSGVSSVSAPASTFTSAYANYRILFNLTSVGADGTIIFRLRSAGTDDSIASYDHALLQYNTNNTSAGYAANINANAWNLNETDGGTNNASYSTVMDIMRPQEATYTVFSGQSQAISTTGLPMSIYGGGWKKTTTQYDSFTFLIGSSFAGRVSVYGYNL